MNNVTGTLGFRLITASFLLVTFFISIAGVSVYKISQDAIKMNSQEMVNEMVEEIRVPLAKGEDIAALSGIITAIKLKKSGSVWMMDQDGYLLYHPDPLYQSEYIDKKKTLGNVIVSLQFAKPRESGQGVHKQKLVDIIKSYDEGFGTYQQFGETRIIAFRVLKEKGWLIAVDEPVASAYSELSRIKRYILYTGLTSAVLIMVFTYLAITIIIKPYYQEVEDLNEKLKETNRQVMDSNAMLGISNKKLTALYKISIAMQETLSLQDILDMIIEGAQEVLHADRINIMLPNKEDTLLICRAAIGAGDRKLSEITLPTSAKGGALSAAYRRGQIITVGEGEHLPANLKLQLPYADDPLLRSSAFVVLPMVVKNKSVGVIALDNKVSRQPITGEMVNLLQIFANQAAVTVENARLYEELKKNMDELENRVDQLSIVNQISNTMQKMVKKRDILGFILRGIKESLNFDLLMICLLDREEEVVRGEIGINVDEGKIAAFAVPIGDEDNVMTTSIRRGMPFNAYSIKEIDFLDLLGGSMHSAGIKESSGTLVEGTKRAVAVIPMTARDETLGVIALARTRRNPFISKREMELLLLFANTAGLAVERANMYEKLHEDFESLEITDHITRIFTFKYGQQRLREEIIKARETARPIVVGMIGIDSFKEYNDRCGLEPGDRALCTIAQLVKSVLADNDIAFRYGGRLISTIHVGKNLAEAKDYLERVRAQVAEQVFPGAAAGSTEHLSVSIGAFEFTGQDLIESSGELFKVAMGHLHRAEAAGGNAVFTG